MILKGCVKDTVTRLLREVTKIHEQDATALPEQYFMAREMRHWRHISVAWNYEVHRTIFADIEWPDSKSLGPRWSYGRWCRLPNAWWEIGSSKADLRRNVKLFHFSGCHLQPWWYLSLLSDDSCSIKEAETVIDAEFRGTDSRGLTGLAVSEWLEAVREAKAAFVGSPHYKHVSDSISSLATTSREYRRTCPRCFRMVWILNQQPLYELSANNKRPNMSCARRGPGNGVKRFKANPGAITAMCCEECVIESSHQWYLKRKTTTLGYADWTAVKRFKSTPAEPAPSDLN